MKKSLILLLLLCFGWAAHAQIVSSGNHQNIFQFTNGQPATHEKFLRQINNIHEAAPNAQIEVVTHGMCVDLLLKENNTFQSTVEDLSKKGVVFVVVEEVIPETQGDKYTDLAVLGFMLGFTIMMILDVSLS